MIKQTLMQLSFLCIAYAVFGAPVLAHHPTLQLTLTPQEIDLYVNNAMKTFNVPGAAVGIVMNDRIILSRGYGTCAVDEASPVTEQTLFPIASCTKAFTAHLLEQLTEEGKISLDDPVITYIPEFKLYTQQLTKSVTIRDLLAHRTGIPRHDALWFYNPIPRINILPLLQYLEPICGLREQYQYNNLMYSVAGMVIERVTGQSWEEAVTTRILRPLEMHDSNVSIDEMQSSSSYSFPHADIGGRVTTIPFHDTYTVNPGGGINATIADMTKWLRFKLTTASPEQLKIEMPFPPPQQEETIYFSGYGLGWYIGKYKGHDTVSHGGDIDGFSSEVAFLPAEGIGLVILTNSGSDGRALISSIKNKIFDAVLDQENSDWVRLLKEGRDKAKTELQAALNQFRAIVEHPYQVSNPDDYVGIYHHPAYGLLEITLEGQDLMISVGNKKMALYPKSEDLFAIELSELLAFGINPVTEVAFRRGETGEIKQIEAAFEIFRGAKAIPFTKKDGFLKVSELHQIYYATYGNPDGTPLLMLHGGPGIGCSEAYTHLVDLDQWHVIMFDQRGAMRSKPFACMEENNTQESIEDIEKLRRHLGISQWHIFGNSWGSCLALAYGEKHPESCLGFILEGIFLGRKQDIGFFNEMGKRSASAYDELLAGIPLEERQDIPGACYSRLMSSDPEVHMPMARALMRYQLMHTPTPPDKETVDQMVGNDRIVLSFMRALVHYVVHECFLAPNQILEDIEKITHLPAILVHGSDDPVCSVEQAITLHQHWPNSHLRIVNDAGHSWREPAIAAALREAFH